MSYEKQNWVDHIEDIETGEVFQEGTLFTAKRMNHIEDGIYNLSSHKDELKIHFIKLNNFGESILVQFDDKNMMVDFGQVGDKDTILSYLTKYNVNKLDYIIITHYHPDHIGSLEYILSKVDVSNCRAYLPCEPNFDSFNENGSEFKSATLNVYNLLNNKSIEKIFPTENQTVDLGEIKLKFNNCNLDYFESYYDTVSEYATNGETDYNNFSLVTTIYHGDVKILLTGDINVTAQEKIIDSIEKCDVYKTEHHSVNTLVSETFLNKINPIISVCCNVNQQSIYYSQTSRFHFEEKKEYYVTYKDGDVVVCSNGNIAYVKSNNKRFEGEIDTFYTFQSVIDNYSSETQLIEVVKALPINTRFISDLYKGDACCPDFVSTYNASIEIYKVTANRATLTIKDFDYYNIRTFNGIWHVSNGDNITWSQDSNSGLIKFYKSFKAIDSDYSQTTTLISLIKKMEANSKLETDLYKGDACCPDFVSTYNASIEIYKVTANRAILTIKDFDYYNIKVYSGVWHISNGDNITWGNVHIENSNELKTYNAIGALSSFGVSITDDALTILKALPVGTFISCNVDQNFASFLSSWGGMATIEKITANIGRIILSDANSTLGKTWVGLYHSSNGDTITWSLLTTSIV